MKSKIFFFLNKLFSYKLNSTQKAQIKLSALVTGIKGAIGGTVFSNAPGGPVAKLKVTFGGGQNPQPPKKTASSQVALWSGRMANEANAGFLQPDGSVFPSTRAINYRSNFKIISKAWSSLLESDRQAWEAVAARYPVKNKFGDNYTASGYQTYKHVNGALINIGLAPVARPECVWETINVGGWPDIYFITCWVCGGVIEYCTQPGDDGPGHGPNTRMSAYFSAGGDNGFLVISASRPLSYGINHKANQKIIAIIKKSDNYVNFILPIILNKFYGKNIYNHNFQISQSLINASGALVKFKTFTYDLKVPAAGFKISYTEKTDTFNWLGSGTTWDFGSHSVPSSTVKTFLPFGCTLPVLSSYTVTLSQGGELNFSIVYGDPGEPLSLDGLLTDKYGNILPIPLQITFSPLSTGIKTGSVTIACGSESVVISVTGTGV